MIQRNQIYNNEKFLRKFLKPGETPEAEFELKVNDIKTLKAREYCNLHGLWQS